MRSLQLAAKAILFLLQVLAFSAPTTISAVGVPSGLMSGAATIEPLILEEDSAVLLPSPDDETASPVGNIAIRAVNPGYNLSSGKNSGELIELINLSDNELDLSSVSIIYTSKPTTASPEGKSSTLYSFPDGARFVSKSILLRFKDSPEAETGLQDLTYDISLAMEGSLKLVFTEILPKESGTSSAETILSEVCWLGGESCLPIFSTTVKSRSYTTILRNDETGDYSHVADYEPLFDSEFPGLFLPSPTSEIEEEPAISDALPTSSSEKGNPLTPVCVGLEFSEFLTYYDEDQTEQFIELYNSSSSHIPLGKCQLRYKSKLYQLSSTPTILAPSSYYLFRPPLALTKNPTTTNLYEIIDINGDIIDSLSLPHGQKKSASYAKIGKRPDGVDLWQITYSPTPGAPNSYQEFRTCPAGKIINEATGNCVNATTITSTLKDCGEGKYRNPTTGRCKSISSSTSSDPTLCKEGYERNPETNRCRKIKQNSGTDYPLVPLTDVEERTSFIALWVLLGIVILGVFYVLFQFRRDIYYFVRKIIAKFKR